MSEFDAIAVDSLGIETLLALLTFAVAAFMPGPASERLGLGPGRLARSHVLLLSAGTLAASSALDGLVVELHWKAASSLGEFEKILAGVRGSSLAFGVLAFAIMPGLAEELFCRGLIQRSLVARIGPARGIAIAAIVFGLLHIDPVHAVFAAPLGLYLGVIGHLDGGIRAAVVCHVINNLVALLSGAYLEESPHGGWPGIVIGAVVAVAVAALVWRTIGPPGRRAPVKGAPPAWDSGSADDPETRH
jgi:membrane protease YdiL (CAAX protease family)